MLHYFILPSTIQTKFACQEIAQSSDYISHCDTTEDNYIDILHAPDWVANLDITMKSVSRKTTMGKYNIRQVCGKANWHRWIHAQWPARSNQQKINAMT